MSTFASDVARLARVLVKHARVAFRSQEDLDRHWQDLGYRDRPDVEAAGVESDGLIERLRSLEIDVIEADGDASVGPDSIYVRDAAVAVPGGVVLARMGKPARAGEPAALRATLERAGVPILGAIEPPGTLEGGDVVWLDARTIAVGRGYRTNDAGIAQLRRTVQDAVDEFIVVPLPHHRGPNDVFHLMSMLSPLADDLALVHRPLCPVPLLDQLAARGVETIDVDPIEFERLGANALALAPRVCILPNGYPRTRARLEATGVLVHEVALDEIGHKGSGGPTCLTRPLERDRAE